MSPMNKRLGVGLCLTSVGGDHLTCACRAASGCKYKSMTVSSYRPAKIPLTDEREWLDRQRGSGR